MHLGSQERCPKITATITVITGAQRLGHNVPDYYAFVLPRLATLRVTTASLSELLPNRWKPAAAAPAITPIP